MIRITPKDKKSVEYRVMLCRGNNIVDVKETYRWGQGFFEDEDWDEDYLEYEKLTLDPNIGPGCDLDDRVQIEFRLNEKTDCALEEQWADGGLTSFLNDGWEIEEEELIIYGPYQKTVDF
jgi:hypothetical protein